MRVLIVSHFFPPHVATASRRIHAIATAFGEAGHDVTVLTSRKRVKDMIAPLDGGNFRVIEVPFRLPRAVEKCRAWLKAGQNQPTQAGASSLRENGTGQSGLGNDRTRRKYSPAGVINAIRRRTGVASAVRMPDLSRYWVRPAAEAARDLAARDGEWDVILSSAGPYTCHLIAMRLMNAGLGKRWIAEYRDLWSGNNLYSGLFPFTLVEHTLDRRVLRCADALVAISEPMSDWIRSRTDKNVHTIYNGYSASELTREFTQTANRPFRLVYTGVLNTSGRNIDAVLGGIAKAIDLGIDVRLELAGENHGPFIEAVRHHKLSGSFHHHGLLPRDAAIQLQRNADALLLVEWHDPRAGVLTSKLFDYIAAGPPILVTGPEGELSNIVRSLDRGLQAGDSPESVARAITSLANQEITFDPSALAISNFSRETQSAKLVRIAELLGSHHADRSCPKPASWAVRESAPPRANMQEMRNA